MISSLSDVNAAYADGRVHVQRVFKNAGTAHTIQWADPTFASGQPAYDAHVGAPLVFTPAIAAKNDAVYFPAIDASHVRKLHKITMQFNQGTFTGAPSIVPFDLVGYYPLIDGDSTDTQTFDNTLTLPRYSTGKGLSLVIVNHVAPALQFGVANIEYVDSLNVVRTKTLRIPNNGVTLVCSGIDASNDTTALVCSLDGLGLKALNSITYTTPPGGLHCAYIIKALPTIPLGDNALVTERDYFTMNAGNMPTVPDGSWIGWFSTIGNGTARSMSWFGDFTFIWG
jgi:hypothetical protein